MEEGTLAEVACRSTSFRSLEELSCRPCTKMEALFEANKLEIATDKEAQRQVRAKDFGVKVIVTTAALVVFTVVIAY